MDKTMSDNAVSDRTMKVWQVESYGNPQQALVMAERPIPEVGDSELLIKVSAIGLNKNEADQCEGIYPTVNPPLPFVPGMEVMGTVVAGAESWLGQRVVACPHNAFGGYAEYAAVPIDMTFVIPDSLSDEDAAAFYMAFQTAHVLLFRRGQLCSGETLLIHAAAGGVGSAALQLAVAAGANVIVTASNKEKLDFCQQLGASAGINYTREDFLEKILELTNGVGVDVALDLVGGSVLEKTLSSIRAEGRYIPGGFSGTAGTEAEETVSLRKLMWANVTVVGGMMGWVDNPDPSLRQFGFKPLARAVGEEIHQDLINLLENKKISPQLNQLVAFEQLPWALTQLNSRQTIGKMVVTLAGLAG